MFYSEEPGLTYDDVLLMPLYSEVLPHEAILKSRFSKNIPLSIPIASSAMDTVTEAQTAITMAQEGGIGVIHKNLTPKQQAKEVNKVKRFESGMVTDPITVKPENSLAYVRERIAEFGFSAFPVADEDGKIVGILTNRDMRYEDDDSRLVKDMMTTRENLVLAEEGLDLEDAKKLLHIHRIEKLPIITLDEKIVGLITVKDIEKSRAHPNANKDEFGRLRVAAAIGVGEKEVARAKQLIAAGVDAIVVDTAHGHSKGVLEMVKAVKEISNEVDVVGGNVATKDACLALINAGADGIKVGIGPGSICTTRVVAGIGVPQLQALMDCREVCQKADIPFIADGGIKYSGDIVKALAVGAETVMIGSLFAGTDEAPGERVIYQGRAYKLYRGMGSLGAMVKGSKDRYGQAGVTEEEKLVPEGIEGQVPYRGSLAENIYQLIGGIRSGMGYTGAHTLKELSEKAKFVKISSAGLKESHPHDVNITKEAPNYRLS
ncbi:MAG: IMP dehydrogenase [Halobacteriovoraceae bacterium]|jgi:IMP dehydrogenase|nr:IMP dehydrogenase [Halobacteriovoraceae bacterium]